MTQEELEKIPIESLYLKEEKDGIVYPKPNTNLSVGWTDGMVQDKNGEWWDITARISDGVKVRVLSTFL